MMSRLAAILTAVALAVALIGCASHPPKVNCEGKLRPINLPAPAVQSDGTSNED